MHKFKVVGQNRQTGQDVTFELSAADYRQAERQANAIGVMVQALEPLSVAHPTSTEPVKPGSIICPNPNCGYRGPALREAKGSRAVAFILLLLFIVPGLLYLVLASGYRYKCPRCGFVIQTDIVR